MNFARPGAAPFRRPAVEVKTTGQPQPPPPVESRFETLLQFEADMRAVPDASALSFLAVNQIRRLVTARQAFLLTAGNRLSRPNPSVTHCSAVSTIDRNAPLIGAIEARARKVIADTNPQAPVSVALSGIDLDASLYAFTHGLLMPLARPGAAPTHWMLLAAERPWTEGEETVAARLAAALGHAFAVFGTSKRRSLGAMLFRRPVMLALVFGSLAALAIPVPLSVLAPVEIVAREAFMVTAPLNGVIAGIHVEPNSKVRAGDLLFDFVDTGIRGEYEVAARAAEVAAARLWRARQGAFASPELRGELAIAEAEVAAETARRDLAAEQLGRAAVHAPKDGIVIFNRKDDWTGKPVSTGEWIMQIADPAKVEAKIDLAVGDTAALDGGGSARIFLDGDPLNPLAAAIVSSGYLAEVTATQGLAYPVVATLRSAAQVPPRIGARGTAQVSGRTVSLGYYLFRKPIAVIRQRIGL